MPIFHGATHAPGLPKRPELPQPRPPRSEPPELPQPKPAKPPKPPVPPAPGTRGKVPPMAAVFFLAAVGLGLLAAGCGLFSGGREPPDHVTVLTVREVHSHLLKADTFLPEPETSRLEPHVPRIILTPAQGRQWRRQPGLLLVLRRIEHLHQLVGEELSTARKFPHILHLNRAESVAGSGIIPGAPRSGGSSSDGGAGPGIGGSLLPGGLTISSEDGGRTVRVDYEGYGAALQPGDQWRIVFAADGTAAEEPSHMEAVVEMSLDEGLPIVLLEVNFAGRWPAAAVAAEGGGGEP